MIAHLVGGPKDGHTQELPDLAENIPITIMLVDDKGTPCAYSSEGVVYEFQQEVELTYIPPSPEVNLTGKQKRSVWAILADFFACDCNWHIHSRIMATLVFSFVNFLLLILVLAIILRKS